MKQNEDKSEQKKLNHWMDCNFPIYVNIGHFSNIPIVRNCLYEKKNDVWNFRPMMQSVADDC